MAPHQLESVSNGESILHGAVLQHNIIAISLLYTSIRLKELSEMLGTDINRIHAVARQMIEEERVVGWIDMVDGLLHFKQGMIAHSIADQYTEH